MNYEELQQAAGRAAQVVKLICAVGNNAAWVVMMDGLDHARRCRGFRRSIRGGHMIGWYFQAAVNEFRDYEHNLLKVKENRMFHVADMSENVRRKYGDISDEEYYEFWKGVGGAAYAKTKPLITSLWNKYRVSLVSHSIKDAEHVAWVMTSQAALDLAVAMYEFALKECEHYELRRPVLEYIFGQFCLRKVSKAWRRAMKLLVPETDTITLDAVEEKNIDYGLRQLMEAWMEPELLYSSTSQAVQDYEEIFATQGQKKKVLREIADVQSATEAELEHQ